MPMSPLYAFEIVPWGYGWGVRVATGFGVPFQFVDTLDEARNIAASMCRRNGQTRVSVLDHYGNTVDVQEIAA
ncbi:MAG: hypothetical protein U5Q44_14055 [Dehalococcoidia bacterium]|nr:hypothetical protein [Dehalococcoidia bacterium]